MNPTIENQTTTYWNREYTFIVSWFFIADGIFFILILCLNVIFAIEKTIYSFDMIGFVIVWIVWIIINVIFCYCLIRDYLDNQRQLPQQQAS